MEKNSKNLKDALRGLQEYEPSSSSWDNIENTLNQAAQAKNLTESIATLPEYEPPTALWDKIESTLDADAKPQSNLRVIKLRRYAAAAVIALLVGSFYWLTSTNLDTNTSGQVEFAVETVDDALLERDWQGEEEDAMAEIYAMCEMHAYVCTQSVFQSLKSELEELTQARDMLREAIGAYGTEEGLLAELKEIEMQRTDIIKQLAKQVA